MKVLLDTHVFLWLNLAQEKLTPEIRDICEESTNDLFISIASFWEIQIKLQLGKLHLNIPWQQMWKVQRQDNGLTLLPIGLEHISALEKLPFIHHDPFDRILIAQAVHEEIIILSADSVFNRYPIKVIC